MTPATFLAFFLFVAVLGMLKSASEKSIDSKSSVDNPSSKTDPTGAIPGERKLEKLVTTPLTVASASPTDLVVNNDAVTVSALPSEEMQLHHSGANTVMSQVISEVEIEPTVTVPATLDEPGIENLTLTMLGIGPEEWILTEHHIHEWD